MIISLVKLPFLFSLSLFSPPTPTTDILLQSGWGADISDSSSWIYKSPKWHIRARTFQDCETTNIVNSQVRNNTRAVVVEHSNTEQYRNSLFIKTAIDWNHLENSLVIAKTTEEFKGLLATCSSQPHMRLNALSISLPPPPPVVS